MFVLTGVSAGFRAYGYWISSRKLIDKFAVCLDLVSCGVLNPVGGKVV